MQQLSLHYDTLLKGDFELKKLNFLFAFQVNCPGCFLHAIPTVNQLYNEFKDQISFLGLSTAFEDFSYNNTANTERLLFKNELVGEVKKAFTEQGLDEYPHTIDFPVTMDTKAPKNFNYEEGAETICQINPNYSTWSQFEQVALKQKVVDYLKKLESISLTFTLNQMRGTPTMLAFNDKKEILLSRFGHTKHEVLQSDLQYLVENFGG